MENIFTLENANKFGEFMEEVKELARKDTDQYQKCATARFCIVGENTMNIIETMYGKIERGWSAGSVGFKNISGKNVKVMTLYFGEYHYLLYENGEERGVFDRTYPRVGVEYNGTIMEAYFGRTSGATLLFPFDYRQYYKKLSTEWKAAHPEPNKIGSLNDKKASEWLEYLTARRDEFERVVGDERNEVDKFLAEVRRVAPMCDEARISEISGRLCKNNLVFGYNISDGYISQKIDVDYRGATTLNTFEKMIKGEF